jgi:hypothetical protein
MPSRASTAGSHGNDAAGAVAAAARTPLPGAASVDADALTVDSDGSDVGSDVGRRNVCTTRLRSCDTAVDNTAPMKSTSLAIGIHDDSGRSSSAPSAGRMPQYREYCDVTWYDATRCDIAHDRARFLARVSRSSASSANEFREKRRTRRLRRSVGRTLTKRTHAATVAHLPLSAPPASLSCQRRHVTHDQAQQ